MKKNSQIKEERKCIKCGRQVHDYENYYEFNEYWEKKLVNANYAHRICWDSFMQQVATTKQAQDMLKRLEPTMVGLGLMQPKEIVIQ